MLRRRMLRPSPAGSELRRLSTAGGGSSDFPPSRQSGAPSRECRLGITVPVFQWGEERSVAEVGDVKKQKTRVCNSNSQVTV
jgi:hypothetical protein